MIFCLTITSWIWKKMTFPIFLSPRFHPSSRPFWDNLQITVSCKTHGLQSQTDLSCNLDLLLINYKNVGRGFGFIIHQVILLQNENNNNVCFRRLLRMSQDIDILFALISLVENTLFGRNTGEDEKTKARSIHDLPLMWPFILFQPMISSTTLKNSLKKNVTAILPLEQILCTWDFYFLPINPSYLVSVPTLNWNCSQWSM